jgi:uncharacterized protein YecE (DUF72 family)
MIHGPKGLFFSGTSGLVLSLTQAQYPEEYKGASRLTYYASLFNSIEINSTFYKLPQASTIRKWGESVPDHFRFTFKLSKSITHSKGLSFNKDEVIAFLQTIGNIGNKKGCILIQFPPSVKQDQLDEVEDLVGQLKAADPKGEWPLALEFRNRAWYTEATYHFLQQYGLTPVRHDFPSCPTPARDVEGPLVYLRFHGPGGKYRGSYGEEDLRTTSVQIKAWRAKGKQVYAYFNNTMGDAANNLQALNRFVSS